MHTSDLLEFGVTLAEHFRAVLSGGNRLDEVQLQKYWLTSRSRFNTWGAKLRRATLHLEQTEYRSSRVWSIWTPMFEEVLIDDVVTRVWASLLQALDDQLDLREYAPIGRSVVAAHEDAWMRVLNLVLRGREADCPDAHHLDRVRTTAERWTDLLLAHASRDLLTVQYCRDPVRFSAYVTAYLDGTAGQLSLVRVAAASAIPKRRLIPTHEGLHRRMQGQLLAAIGPELSLPAAGRMTASWQTRLICLADETQLMIDRWLALESDGTSR